MDSGNLELFLIFLIIIAVFFFSGCNMKCKVLNGSEDRFDYIDEGDSAYSLPFAGGEITPGAWTLPFGGGKVLQEGTYADKGGIGTF